MTNESFTTRFTVPQSPAEAIRAIKNVRGWWSEEIEGATESLGDEFVYRYEDLHRSKQKMVEDVPEQRVVWRVLDGYLSFVKDKQEWTGTALRFDVARVGNETEVRFTHEGLARTQQCFDMCSDAWTHYVQHSLRNLITTGVGEPNHAEPDANAKKKAKAAKSAQKEKQA